MNKIKIKKKKEKVKYIQSLYSINISVVNFEKKLLIKIKCLLGIWAQWYTSIIPILRRLRQ
jgi:hypothetical protein